MPQLLPVRFVLRFYGRILAGLILGILWLIGVQPVSFFPEISTPFFGQQHSEPPLGVEETLLPLAGESPGVMQVWRIPAENQRGTAIFFRGNGGPLAYHLAIPRWLSARGYTTYMMNYPGYEKSSGFPSEALLTRESEILLRYVVSRGQEPTILAGFSIGTPLAARLASIANPQCLMLIAPLASARDAIADQPVFGPFFDLLSGILLYSLDTTESVSRLKITNLLLLAAERDTVLPVRHARKIAKAYRGLWIGERYSPSADHNTVFAQESAGLEPLFERCIGLR